MKIHAKSFMFNRKSKFCTPSGPLNPSESLPSADEGDFYAILQPLELTTSLPYENTTSFIDVFNNTEARYETTLESTIENATQQPDVFRKMFRNNTTACLSFFNKTMNYTNASDYCDRIGCFLVSVKTYDKLMILGDSAVSSDVWVGCDDMPKRDQFFWKEDRSPVTNETMDVICKGNRLTSYNTDSCCYYMRSKARVGADSCSLSFGFVCEKPFHLCY